MKTLNGEISVEEFLENKTICLIAESTDLDIAGIYTLNVAQAIELAIDLLNAAQDLQKTKCAGIHCFEEK